MRKLTATFCPTLCICLFALSAVADPPYCPLTIFFSDGKNFDEFLEVLEKKQSGQDRKKSVTQYFKSKNLSNPSLMSENYFSESYHHEDLKFDREKMEIQFTFGNGISYYQKYFYESKWGDTTKKLLQEWSILTTSEIRWEDCDHYGNAKIFYTG
tara:strand:- start:247 stop:711 length:465 start_codon:yes stop_codon:yes gene_type:complete